MYVRKIKERCRWIGTMEEASMVQTVRASVQDQQGTCACGICSASVSGDQSLLCACRGDHIHWSGLRNSERRAHRRFGGVVLSARSAVSIASNCSRWACFILPDRTAQNCAFRATKAQICRDDLILFWDSLLSAIVRGAEITLLDVTDYGAEILDTLACVG